jgi:hypothetical protein
MCSVEIFQRTLSPTCEGESRKSRVEELEGQELAQHINRKTPSHETKRASMVCATALKGETGHMTVLRHLPLVMLEQPSKRFVAGDLVKRDKVRRFRRWLATFVEQYIADALMRPKSVKI